MKLEMSPPQAGGKLKRRQCQERRSRNDMQPGHDPVRVIAGVERFSRFPSRAHQRVSAAQSVENLLPYRFGSPRQIADEHDPDHRGKDTDHSRPQQREETMASAHDLSAEPFDRITSA